VNSGNDIKKRLFIVGAARSGTTLLQSMIAVHPDIYSFPETHFFSGTMPKQKLLRAFKVFGSRDHHFIENFLSRIHHGDLSSHLPKHPFSAKIWTKRLIGILDTIALKADCHIWLEKTPMHLYYIDIINKVTSQSFFMHMLRQGKDMIASLYEASHKKPEYFGGERSIDQCIQRWKNDIRFSLKYYDKKAHSFVKYENLVVDPESVLKKLCKEIGIDFYPQMLDYTEKAKDIFFPEETWKNKNVKPLQLSYKFNTLFSEKEQAYILKHINSTDLSCFE
jgi:hypothetical protein